jgi:hypothetical protein
LDDLAPPLLFIVFLVATWRLPVRNLSNLVAPSQRKADV